MRYSYSSRDSNAAPSSGTSPVAHFLVALPRGTCPAADSKEFSINAIQLRQNHNVWLHFTSETINVTNNI